MPAIDEDTSDWTHARECAAALTDDLLRGITDYQVVKLTYPRTQQLCLTHARTLLKASALTSACGSRFYPTKLHDHGHQGIKLHRLESVRRYNKTLEAVIARIVQHNVDLLETKLPKGFIECIDWATDDDEASSNDDKIKVFAKALHTRMGKAIERLETCMASDIGTGHESRTFDVLHEAVCTANEVNSFLLLRGSLSATIAGLHWTLSNSEYTGDVKAWSEALETLVTRQKEIEHELGEANFDVGWSVNVLWELQEGVKRFMEDDRWEEALESTWSRATPNDSPALPRDYTLGEIEAGCGEAFQQFFDADATNKVGVPEEVGPSVVLGCAPTVGSLISRTKAITADGFLTQGDSE